MGWGVLPKPAHSLNAQGLEAQRVGIPRKGADSGFSTPSSSSRRATATPCFTVLRVYNGAPCLTSPSPSGQRLRVGLRTRSPVRVPTIAGPHHHRAQVRPPPPLLPARFLVLPAPHCLIPESPLHELPPIQDFQAPGGRGLEVECAPLIL